MTPHRCCPARHGFWTASSGRRSRTFVPWFKARRPAVDRSPRVPCGSRTRDLVLPRPTGPCFAWCPVGARRNTRLSYVLFQEHPAGVEPGTTRSVVLLPWQSSRLPLHHGRVEVCRIVKDQEHPTTASRRCPDSNPRRRMTTAAQRCPVRYPCRWTTSAIVSVGPEGLEPLLAGLKVRCAAVTLRPRHAGRAYPFPSCLRHGRVLRSQW